MLAIKSFLSVLINRKDEISTEKTGGKKLEDISSLSTGKIETACPLAQNWKKQLRLEFRRL